MIAFSGSASGAPPSSASAPGGSLQPLNLLALSFRYTPRDSWPAKASRSARVEPKAAARALTMTGVPWDWR